MSLKITAITGSRADWGLISPVLELLKEDDFFSLKLIVTGQHIPSETYKNIEDEGFSDYYKLDMGLGENDSAEATTKALAKEIKELAEILAKDRPDIFLINADRYEMLGATQAAMMAGIPIAHMFGGEITEGAIDDSIRHAISKFAHIHFVTNKDAKKRLLKMGEQPENVHITGNPGLDHIHTIEKLNRDDFFNEVSFMPRKENYLITLHPVTLENNSIDQCNEMLKALEELGNDTGLIFTASNADPEGVKITKAIQNFVKTHENSIFRETLGTRLYLNALRHVNAMIGNSSSGLYEAPSFNTWTINIGNRQKGRIRAKTVIDCPPEKNAILKAIQALPEEKPQNIENPYGDGHTAKRIVDILKKTKAPHNLLKKIFYES